MRERVGVVSNGGAVMFDLPTVVGTDRDEDVEGIGNVADLVEIALIQLSLQPTGYVLDFENFIPVGGVRPANAYTTDVLPYNGTATDISRLEFTIKGDPNDNSFRGGHVLDNIFASGTVVTGGIDGDFNDDGAIDCQDINSLVAEIVTGTNSVGFDLNSDGTVDGADQTEWLAQAASENGLVSPYKVGDANLDGVVDVGDFNAWNANKFTSSDSQAVPEPGIQVHLLVILAWATFFLRKK